MKVLWIAKNDIGNIGSYFYYLRMKLSKYVDLIPHGPRFQSPDIYETDLVKLTKIYEPDIIWFTGSRGVLYNLENPRWKNLDKIKTPTVLFYSDSQSSTEKRMKWIKKNKINMTLHAFKKATHKYDLEWFISNMPAEHLSRWLPPSVPIDIYKNLGLNRIYDICLLGRVYHSMYPLRTIIWKTLLQENFEPRNNIEFKVNNKILKIFYRYRPRGWGYTPETTLMRETYVEAINKCKIFPFDGSIYKLPILKYFECMATKTLALADTPLDAEDLHFKAGYNYIEIDKENFIDKIIYYLDNEKEQKKITENGVATIFRYHSMETRVKQLINYMKELL